MTTSAVATPITTQPRDPDTPALGLDDLRQLMRTVTETTQRLEHTHAALQQEVARLKAELADANAQLRRSRALAALGEMAAGIAHEVRNPLASIGLYAQMLAEDLAEPAASDAAGPAELCHKITGAVDRIDAIVRDVLRFAADTTPQTSTITVQELVDRALEDCRSALDRAQIALTGPGPQAGALSVEVDSGLMVQALGNVIRNGVEALADPRETRRELRLEAAHREMRIPDGGCEHRVVIAVHDTGPGISPEVLTRMFNPFFTTRPTGTGLGLAIVHRIVEAHGGHVAVTNRGASGTTVSLCLPPTARNHERSKE